MRAWLGITLALTGCSLVVNPRAQNEYDLVDAAQGTIPDGGEGRSDAATDAGPDGGLDAGLDVPASPVLRFPWNGYMTGSVHTGALPAERNALRPRFVWEPSEGAERYELQLTASCEAQTRASCVFDGAIEGVTSQNEWRPEEALPVSMAPPVGRRYVWRARACNAAGCSDWSQVRYLDVGRQPSDFNGDGYADVLIGAPGEDAGAEGQAGRSFTFYGPAPAESVGAYQTEHPTVANAAFGGSVAAVGDVNGDGFSDAIITAPLASYGGTALAGRALFFPGGADQLPMRPEATLESLHPVSEGLFGVAVAGAGDLDGDGFSDVVISADGEEVGGVQRAGRVYVFAGSAGGFVAPPVELTSPTPTPAGRFGYFVSVGGDVNGDGTCDLAVGAPAESGGGVAGAGRVYLYWSPLAGGPPDVSLTSATPTSSGMFGMSVHIGSDYDGDGFADVAIGAPAEEVDSAAAAGRVYLFAGSRSGLGSLPSLTLDGDPVVAESFFGFMLAGADLNGDGVHDLAVGAPHRSAAAVTVFAGSPTGLSTRERVGDPGNEGGTFGAALAVGDIDGNGASDLVVGAPTRTVNGMAQVGSVHGFMNDVDQVASEPAWSLTGTESQPGRFGAAMSQTAGTWFGERE